MNTYLSIYDNNSLNSSRNGKYLRQKLQKKLKQHTFMFNAFLLEVVPFMP